MRFWSCVRCLLPLPYSSDWSFLERSVTAGSYCSDFRVVRACLVEIPFYSFDLPFPRLTMRTPLGLSRSSVLRIGGSSVEEPDLGQTGEGSGHLAIVVDRVPLAGPYKPLHFFSPYQCEIGVMNKEVNFPFETKLKP